MHELIRKQFLPIDIKKAWEFFSKPSNLQKITPEYMGFNITVNPGNVKMFPGMIIGYTVKPLFGIPVKWITEITHVRENVYFIDEQRFGPYKFWHHRHDFKALDSGTEMTDTVYYLLPLGIAGRLIQKLFVRRKLEEIFNHREKVISKIFSS